MFNIKTLRKSRGMTLSVLSEKTNLTSGYLSELETGKKNNPSFETLERLAKALGVTITELMDEKVG